MTRYQCIKNFPPFQAGKVYIGSEPDNRSNRGRILMNVSSDIEPVFVTPAHVQEHFKVLEEPVLVPDPYNDHEAQEYSYLLQPPENLTRGLVIATVITIAIVLLYVYII